MTKQEADIAMAIGRLVEVAERVGSDIVQALDAINTKIDKCLARGSAEQDHEGANDVVDA